MEALSPTMAEWERQALATVIDEIMVQEWLDWLGETIKE